MAAKGVWRGRGAERLRPARRRGVLLLVVLSLLTLFAIIAVTFVLIARSHRISTRNETVKERYSNDPQKQLDSLAMDVFRGTTNAMSPIQHHSLLEDMYGLPALTGAVTAVNAVTPNGGGTNFQQLLDLTVTSSDLNFSSGVTANSATIATPQSNPLSYMAYGYYNGQVITMTSGPARGMSTRIVGSCLQQPSNPPTGAQLNLYLRVMAFDGISSQNFITQSTSGVYANVAQRFVINGRAFNGTGVGYNTSVNQTFPRQSGGSFTSYTLLDATDNNGFYYALMPNAKYFQSNGINYATPTGPGGANEDYDAPDAQNPFLAWQPIGVSNSAQIIPSFHRPDLAAWWMNNTNTSSAWSSNNGNVQEKVILRPLQTDHPLFTGSNSSFKYITGPWDVDNDGDGIADSVWIDPGYPVQTAADGMQYKVLAAYMILDLDGRLNVNAHGNLAQTQAFMTDPNSGSADPLNASYSQGPYAMVASNPTSPPVNGSTGGASVVGSGSNYMLNQAQLPRGAGYGPAEINPGYLLTATSNTSPATGASNPLFTSLLQYQQLMTGIYSSAYGEKYDGRYGELPYGSGMPTPLPGNSTNTTPTQPYSADDALSVIKHSDLPFGPASASLMQTYATTINSYYQNLLLFQNASYGGMTSYGTPSDIWGRMALGLDFGGQPLYLFPNPNSFGGTAGGSRSSLGGSGAALLAWETPNNPYALNLSRQAIRGALQQNAIDNPYTPAELERLLRRFDVDSYALPDRLRAVIEDYDSGGGYSGTNANPALRQYLTTESYDVASPSVQAPTEVRQNTLNSGAQAQYPDLVREAQTEGSSNPQNATLNLNIADLLRAKLTNSTNGMTTLSGNPASDAPLINGQLVMMLPPELVAGQMMDLNRPFGNGRDDNGNYVVDEPQEYLYQNNQEGAWGQMNNGQHWAGLMSNLFPQLSQATTFNLLNFVDVNNDNYQSFNKVTAKDTNGYQYSNSQLYARQIYARHLYVLMMLLVDQGFVQPGPMAGGTQYPGVNTGTTQPSNQWANVVDWGSATEPNLTAQVQQEITARRIAQWAINVVDFRDQDGIMTPFEYDVNPFNGWQVDGIVDTIENTTANQPVTIPSGTTTNASNIADYNSERRIVWGCEYPELMLTETFATHDRRVRDCNVDSTGTKNPRYIYNPAVPLQPWVLQDPTMDQIRIPQGSLFVELFCPRSQNGSQVTLPADLYTFQNGQPQLNLAQVCADGANPVWRLVITTSNKQNLSGNIYSRMQTNPVTTSLDPPDIAASGSSTSSHNFSIWSSNPANPPSSGATTATIERIVWFSTTAPPNNNPNYAKIFYNQGTSQNGTALMNPGTYALIGPRPLTIFGRLQNIGYSPAPLPQLSPQAIQITNLPGANHNPPTFYTSTNGTLGTKANSYPVVGTSIQQPLGIVCGSAGPPTSWQPNSPAIQSGMRGVGLSVSEPLFANGQTVYYAEPTHSDSVVSTVFSGLFDSYGQDNGTGTTSAGFLDQPYETIAGSPPGGLTAPTGLPLNIDNLQATGTTLFYKTVVLQRLANPLLGYNPMPGDVNEPFYNQNMPVNPYVSIDWMPINLTVFNGEQIPVADALNPSVSIDPDEAASANSSTFYSGNLNTGTGAPQAGTSGQLATGGAAFPPANGAINGTFCTVQRGLTNINGTANLSSDLNIWQQTFDITAPLGSGLRGSNNLVFDWGLDNASQPTNATSTMPAYYCHTLGYLNRAFLGSGTNLAFPWSGAGGYFIGDPVPQNWISQTPAAASSTVTNRTFPWIPWNNRPYVSHYELMQVPASSPGRLMWEFGFTGSLNIPVPGANTTNPYDATNGGAPTSASPSPFLAPFKHLLNFELTTSPGNGTTQPRQNDFGVAPHFYRLFDYVRVPSRFVGTETVLNPSYTTGQLADNNIAVTDNNLQGAQAANLEKAMASYLHPPFNRVSKHRDPGKININTISHLNTLQLGGGVGAVGGTTDSNAFIWNATVNAPLASNNGGGSTSMAQTLSGPLWSSVCVSVHSNNINTSTGSYLTTGATLTPSWFANPFRSAAGADLQLPPGLPLRGVDATLLRPFGYVPVPISGGSTTTGNTSPYLLFDFPPAEIAASGGAGSPAYQAYNAPDRNSYFRYQNLQRMGNLLTTRSNVYAVWVTVGYFQVQPWNGGTADFAHPDGYQLADELGSDAGTVERHRGFYIFDRTIPVGFERGLNHNVEKAILLKRFIE